MYITNPISVKVLPELKLEDKISNFLDDQLNYRLEDKCHIISGFKKDLQYRINLEGLTDENLLVGLVLNNYERQLGKPKDNLIKIEKVTYNIG